jgi:hypothetical protein
LKSEFDNLLQSKQDSDRQNDTKKKTVRAKKIELMEMTQTSIKLEDTIRVLTKEIDSHKAKEAEWALQSTQREIFDSEQLQMTGLLKSELENIRNSYSDCEKGDYSGSEEILSKNLQFLSEKVKRISDLEFENNKLRLENNSMTDRILRDGKNTDL